MNTYREKLNNIADQFDSELNEAKRKIYNEVATLYISRINELENRNEILNKQIDDLEFNNSVLNAENNKLSDEKKALEQEKSELRTNLILKYNKLYDAYVKLFDSDRGIKYEEMTGKYREFYPISDTEINSKIKSDEITPENNDKESSVLDEIPNYAKPGKSDKMEYKPKLNTQQVLNKAKSENNELAGWLANLISTTFDRDWFNYDSLLDEVKELEKKFKIK